MRTSSGSRVAVAGAHPFFRAGLVELLHDLDGVEVVGEAASRAEAISLVETERPVLLLLDPDLPGAAEPGGCGTLFALRAINPELRVIVLTAQDDPDQVRQFVAAGVSGYLLKSAGREELCAALRTADDPGALLLRVSRVTALALLSRDRQGDTLLTTRELQVLELASDGLSNRGIAAALHLAEATVKRHLATVYGKLDVGSRTQAVARARTLGLLA